MVARGDGDGEPDWAADFDTKEGVARSEASNELGEDGANDSTESRKGRDSRSSFLAAVFEDKLETSEITESLVCSVGAGRNERTRDGGRQSWVASPRSVSAKAGKGPKVDQALFVLKKGTSEGNEEEEEEKEEIEDAPGGSNAEFAGAARVWTVDRVV